ncbi:hypothetical protein LINPERHAP1_LOCUS15166 [Linum perenne]
MEGGLEVAHTSEGAAFHLEIV